MTLRVKDLDAPLGAEISGINLSSSITPSDLETIEDAWRERLVVVFHDQELSDPQLIAFSKNFGELDPPGPNPYGEPFLKDHPELNVISYAVFCLKKKKNHNAHTLVHHITIDSVYIA